jgi:hypothetical protein
VQIAARFWSAPAKRSGDGAFELGENVNIRKAFFQSGVAPALAGLPPQSKRFAKFGEAPWSHQRLGYDSFNTLVFFSDWL